MHLARWLLPLAALALSTWPLARRPAGEGLGYPGLEAVDHLWALWAALRDGPLVLDTDLVNYPAGMRWVLADPLNLPAFALGNALGGAGLGWNLSVLGNLSLAGLAAALWARRLTPDPAAPPLAAALAVCLPPLTANLATGMSEALTLGLAALALWALAQLGDALTWPRAVLAGLLAGLCAWGGPYTALYAALGAPPVLAGLAWAHRGRLGALAGRLALAGGVAAALAAPIARAVLVERPPGLPGANSQIYEVIADPGAAKNLALGADPLGILWPLPGVEPLHSAFLGTGLLALAAWGARRAPPRALLASAGVLIALGLGFHLQLGGELAQVGGRALSLPARWLTEAIPPLGRAARWHRSLAVAGVLLAPLAARGAADLARRLPRGQGLALAALGALLCAELLWRPAVPWPRPTFAVDAPAGYAQLSPGPLLPLPLARFSSGDPQQLRSPLLLWQAEHGHPLGGNPRQPGPAFRDPRVTAAAKRLLDGEVGGAEAAKALGFAWVVVHNARDVERVRRALGEPDVSAEPVWGWKLE